MTDSISITGTIATEPRHTVSSSGRAITSFRLASAQRRIDRQSGTWVDGTTNWYTVSSFGSLAINAAASLHKGERIVVRGRLQIRDWEDGERRGTVVEIIAESVGHDLLWGRSVFHRSAGAGDDTSFTSASEVEENDATVGVGRSEHDHELAPQTSEPVAVPF